MFCCDKSKMHWSMTKHSHEPFIISQNNTFQAKSWEHGCPQKMWTRTTDLNTPTAAISETRILWRCERVVGRKSLPLNPKKNIFMVVWTFFGIICHHHHSGEIKGVWSHESWLGLPTSLNWSLGTDITNTNDMQNSNYKGEDQIVFNLDQSHMP